MHKKKKFKYIKDLHLFFIINTLDFYRRNTIINIFLVEYIQPTV